MLELARPQVGIGRLNTAVDGPSLPLETPSLHPAPPPVKVRTVFKTFFIVVLNSWQSVCYWLLSKKMLLSAKKMSRSLRMRLI